MAETTPPSGGANVLELKTTQSSPPSSEAQPK